MGKNNGPNCNGIYCIVARGSFVWVKPKVIHTRTFSCENDHPIVWYTFDEKNKAMCEYCATHFIYEPEERTYSEEMQDDLEPIEDSYVNKILKGSG